MLITNPTVSEMKSAVQKLIRRGMWQDAVNAAAVMARKDLSSLIRRLYVICAEDVGWESLQWVGPKLTEIEKMEGRPEGPSLALGIVKALALYTPKNMGTVFLQMIGEFAPKPVFDWEGEYKKAVEAKDLRSVAHMMSALHELASGAKQCATLRKYFPDPLPADIKDAAEAVQKRVTVGGMFPGDTDYFVLATAQIAMGIYEPCVEIKIEPEPVPIVSDSISLPWWCVDPHIYAGKMALRAAAKQFPDIHKDKGEAYERLRWIWWWMESRQLDPATKHPEILREAIDASLKAKCQMTYEDAKKVWEGGAGTKMRALVEWAVRKVRTEQSSEVRY